MTVTNCSWQLCHPELGLRVVSWTKAEVAAGDTDRDQKGARDSVSALQCASCELRMLSGSQICLTMDFKSHFDSYYFI